MLFQNKIFKICYIVFFLSLLLPCFIFVLTAQAQVNVDYPDIVDIEPPEARPFFLPDYIRYVYQFAVAIGGFIALGATIAGGLRYLTSAGNPSRMSDARNQIIMGLLGIVIVLGAFVFLHEINPDLISLEIPQIKGLSGKGIILYTDDKCGKGSNGWPNLNFPLPEDVDFEKIEGSRSLDSEFNVSSIWFSTPMPELSKIMLYKNKSCEGSPDFSYSPEKDTPYCYEGLNISDVQCVRLIWNMGGVWVFSYEDGDPREPKGDKAWEHYRLDENVLPPGLSDNVRSIALVHDDQREVNFGTILHRAEGSRDFNKEWAHIYLPTETDTTKINVGKNHLSGSEKVKSITVFTVDPGAPDKAITICMNENCASQPDATGEAQDATITYEWDDLDTLPNPPFPEDLARGVIFREKTSINTYGDGAEWWEDGLRVLVCNRQSFTAPVFDLDNACFAGVSAIQFEPGASYLAVLYHTKMNKWDNPWKYGNYSPFYDQRDGLIVNGTVRWLGGTYAFNDMAGAMIVIKIK
jgi:hypothetical protein